MMDADRIRQAVRVIESHPLDPDAPTTDEWEAALVEVVRAAIALADLLDGPTDEDIRIGTEAALRLNNVEPSEASIDLWNDYEEEVQVALEAVFQARKERG